MAQTEHLPIYKAAYDLCVYVEQIVRNFSRHHKYSIGQELRDGARRVLKLEPRFSRQYARLIRHGGDRALVFCQVGRFIEFYGPQREAATRALGLVRVKIARGGFGFSVGFPMRLGAAYVSLRAGYTVVEVREVGRVGPRCAARRLESVWIPAAGPIKPAQRSRPMAPAVED